MDERRIAAVTFDYYPFDVRVRRLAEAAADGGFRTDVICLRQPGEAAREVYNGVEIFRVPQARGFGNALPLTVLAWCWFIVLAGAVLTWAAHSSIAVVLLAMSLAANAVLPLPAAMAMALGANLGTALNPVLEGGAGADPAGRRLALGNLLNRLVGVAVALALFAWLPPLVAAVESAPGRAVANFHTAFNLVLALAFFPWLPLYARLLERWLPVRPAQDTPGAPLYLDPTARDMPSAALGGAAREALRMADVLEQMLAGLRAALVKSSRRQIEETQRLDDVLDRLNTAIKDYVMSIEAARLSEADGRMTARILAFSINLEQAGDLVDRNLLGVVSRRLQRGLSFSPEGEADLVAQVDRLIANARTAAALFVSGDERAAHALAAEKAAFREIEERATAAHFRRMRSGDVETLETSAMHLDALRDLKRVNAHLVEAAADPILRQRGDLLPSRIRRLGTGEDGAKA
jgi:phosphate:Na+ symporter